MMKNLYKEAIIHGRFQPFHFGHLNYIKYAFMFSEKLIIGIDSQLPIMNTLDDKRYNSEDNPFSFEERLQMVKNSLIDAGIKSDFFKVVELPITDIEMLRTYYKEKTFLIPIYGEKGKSKYELLKKNGLDAQILIKDNEANRPISGTEIRKKIALGQQIDNFVPKEAMRIIELKYRLK